MKRLEMADDRNGVKRSIMRIAFDGQLFLKGNKTGIAWNAHNLISELVKYPENQCIIQCFTYKCTEEYRKILHEYQKMGCRIERCRWFRYVWYQYLWMILPVPYRCFFFSQVDLTQFFNYAVPPGVREKSVTIIHDMAYKSCPDTVQLKTRIWLKWSMKRSCKHADRIITVSEFSKREICKYLQVRKDKVTVIPNAVDHTIFHPNYTESQIQQVLSKYKIERNYFLYLGTIEPRKNLERLIGAYEKLYRKDKDIPQLVLAGGKGWLCESIYKKAHRLVLKQKIIFTGYVKQEESPALMCGARVFVFPSLYEGFGMPPLEAMACGTPVIVSNTAALPEVVGDAGILVNPQKENEICRAMKEMLTDDRSRERYRELGLKRAGQFTWANAAAKLMKVYQSM